MSASTIDSDQLMTTQELADYLSIRLETIYAWRSRHKAPPGIRVGRYLRFRRSDVDAWLAESRAL